MAEDLRNVFLTKLLNFSSTAEPESATDKSADPQITSADALGVVDATYVYVTVDKE